MLAATTSSVSGSSEPKPSSRKIDSNVADPAAASSIVLSASARARASDARNVSPPESDRASRTSSALRWSTILKAESSVVSEY
jgi:hypothetical protein